jgi:ABC-type multidrug transport system permease subunit
MQVVTEHNQNKPIGQVVQELKNDARDFIQTRLEILSQEMKSKIDIWKVAIPMMVVAAVMAWVSFLVLTFALVSFLAGIFLPSPYAWCFGALIVFAIYLMGAFLLFYLAKKEMQQAGLAPTRTMRVLKDDQIWMQNEARSQA